MTRFCPVCGTHSEADFCAKDGTATVVQRTLLPADLDYSPGRVVQGRYRIVDRIGRGGFGAVYSAIHTGTGQDVALKLLHVDLSSDNIEIVRRFWQEAQITARLRSAHTVRVFDVGQTEEGAFYLTMEHLHGVTLAAVLDDLARRGTTMHQREALRIAIEICRSLQEAHRAGLVHRDLKPGNVMLVRHDDEAEAQAKVLDFGIARRADSSLTGQGAALGTPAYMSPEQCRGLDVDGRSDLYALGVILFRCVAGRTPYVDENPLTVMFQHTIAAIPDPRTWAKQSVSDEVAALIRRALAKDPNERFADAKELREALETLRAMTPTEEHETLIVLPATADRGREIVAAAPTVAAIAALDAGAAVSAEAAVAVSDPQRIVPADDAVQAKLATGRVALPDGPQAPAPVDAAGAAALSASPAFWAAAIAGVVAVAVATATLWPSAPRGTADGAGATIEAVDIVSTPSPQDQHDAAAGEDDAVPRAGDDAAQDDAAQDDAAQDDAAQDDAAQDDATQVEDTTAAPRPASTPSPGGKSSPSAKPGAASGKTRPFALDDEPKAAPARPGSAATPAAKDASGGQPETATKPAAVAPKAGSGPDRPIATTTPAPAPTVKRPERPVPLD